MQNNSISKKRRFGRCVVFIVLLWTLAGGSHTWAQDADDGGDDWQVKREDREEIIASRLKGMLRSKPFSSYAYAQLLKLYKGANRTRLLYEYARLVRKAPKNLSHRIVLGRLLRGRGRYRQAYSLFRSVRKSKPRWLDVMLAEAACLLGMKKQAEAIALFRVILPRVKGKTRASILQKILRAGLKVKDDRAVRFALERINKQRMGRQRRILLARLLVQYKYTPEALFHYERALKGARGETQVNLLMEMCRLELGEKRFEKAMARIKAARRVRTNLKWLRRELLALEIDVYRRQGRLPEFLEKLAPKYKASKNYENVVMLARLYHEAKMQKEGMEMDKRALKLRPSARQPRMRLYNIYKDRRQFDLAREQMLALIRYKGAEPKHYLLLARENFKRSNIQHFTENRWSPYWANLSLCRSLRVQKQQQQLRRHTPGRVSPRGSSPSYRWGSLRGSGGRFGYRYRYGYRYRRPSYASNKAKAKCSRKTWNQYRKKRLQTWVRYYRTLPEKRKSFQAGIRLLKACVRQFPRRWDALKESERLLDRYGEYKSANTALNRLIQSTDSDLGQIQYMRRLLYQTGRLSTYRSILVRAMRRSTSAPIPAMELASFVYRNWLRQKHAYSQKNSKKPRVSRRRMIVTLGSRRYARTRRYARSSLTLQKPPRVWKSSPCPHIRRMLSRVGRRLTPLYAERHADVITRVSVIAWACGSRDRKLKRLVMAQEKKIASDPAGAKKLLRTYVEYKYEAGFDRLLGEIAKNQNPEWMLSFLSPMLARRDPSSSQFLLKRFQKRFAKTPEFLCRSVEAFCQSQWNCNKVLPILSFLMKQPNVPPIPMLKAIHASARFSLFSDERLGWLRTLAQSSQDNVKALQWMAEHVRLFQYVRNYRMRPHYYGLQRQIMMRVLTLRMVEPENTTAWLRLVQQQYSVVARRPLERAKMLKEMRPLLDKFPILQRRVLGFMLRDYRYRKYARLRLVEQLKRKKLSLEDIQLLRQHYMDLGEKRQEMMIGIIRRLKQPDFLGLIEDFARNRYGLVPVQIAVLRRLLEIRPKDPHVMRRLARCLDLQKNDKEADRYWLKLLETERASWTDDFLKKLAGSCCADRASERHARRVFSIVLRSRELEPLWDSMKNLLPKLEKDQQGLLLGELLRSGKLTRARELELADLAYQKDLRSLAISLYRKYLKGGGKPQHYERIATLLDRSARYREADTFWRGYLKGKRIGNAKRFFEKQGKTYQAKGKRMLAMVSFYRALSKQRPSSESKVKAAIAKLQRNDEPLRAWARWLWLQGEQGAACLQKTAEVKTSKPLAKKLLKTGSSLVLRGKSSNQVPVTLWKMNLPFEGPLLFFSRCHWDLPEKARPVVQQLALFLKRNPSYALRLRGSSSSKEEPDAKFLARQRAFVLQQELTRRGINVQRISIQVSDDQLLCQGGTAQAKLSQSCEEYRRQVSIGKVIVPQAVLARRDVDQDGIPDTLDQCPLVAGRRYQYRYGRRYRMGRRSRSYRYRMGRRIRTVQQRLGCPPFLRRMPKSMVMRKKDELRFLNTYLFYYGRYSLHSTGRQSIDQLAALLRLAPSLGHIRIELTPVIPKARRNPLSRYRGYFGRSYRGRMASTTRMAYIAKRQAEALRNRLIMRGVPRRRLSLKVNPPLESPVATSQPQPKVIFRIFGKNPPSIVVPGGKVVTPPKVSTSRL